MTLAKGCILTDLAELRKLGPKPTVEKGNLI